MRYDYTTDTNGAIFEHAYEHGLIPGFVKQSTRITADSVAELHSRAFADERARLYPCHTKEATILSAVYSQAQGDDSLEVREKIASVADAFGVRAEVDKVFDHFDRLAAEVRARQEAAKPRFIQKFALTLRDPDGKEHNMYDISTAADTAVSIRQLDDDYRCGRVPLPFMRKIACEVCEAAAMQDISCVPNTILKFADTRLPDYNATENLFALRRRAVGDEAMAGYRRELAAMWDGMSKAASVDEAIEAMDKAAAALCVLDVDNGVEYTTWQPDPYTCLFTGVSKSDFLKHAATHVHILGVAVPADAVEGVDLARVAARLPKSAATTLREAVAALPGDTSACGEKIASLSRDEQMEILKIAAGS